MTLEPRYYFSILTSSGVPIYRQIIDQVKIHIATGRLKEGDFLPSVRQVGKELEINPMTVSKAYSLLEKEGVLEAVRGQGMRVLKSPTAGKSVTSGEAQMTPLLQEVIARAHQVSLDKKHLINLIHDLWKE